MKTKVILASALALILFSTCVKKVGNKDMSFKDQILPIFTSNCAGSGCHNSKDKEADLDLSNYEGIMKAVVPFRPLQSEVYTNIKGNNPSMPLAPYSKLKSKDVELIKLWINMGAPNNVIETSCDTNVVTFQKSVQPILQTWCVSCHNNSNLSGGINLSTHDGVVNSLNNNRLLGSIKYLNGYSKMPQNGTQLSSCDISKIEKWIRSGAANN